MTKHLQGVLIILNINSVHIKTITLHYFLPPAPGKSHSISYLHTSNYSRYFIYVEWHNVCRFVSGLLQIA